MILRIAISITAALALHSAAFAHEYKAGDLRIGHPSARSTKPGQPSAGAYVTIENTGQQADRLLAASSPIAKSTQIHTMAMDGNVMKMREVDGVDLPPNSKVAMQPGDGYHIMLMGLKKPLAAGDKFPMTLRFEKAGKVDVSVKVEDQAATQNKPDGMMGEHRMQH